MILDNPLTGVIFITYTDIQKRIRKRKLRFKIILIIMLISAAVVFLFEKPVLKVADISVSGNNTIEAKRIVDLSGIKIGDNLLRMNTYAIKKNILGNSYISDCKIKRNLLGSVRIMVEERKSVCIVKFENKYLILDRNGVVMDIIDRNNNIKLPMLTGLGIKSIEKNKVIDINDERQLDTLKIIFDSITRYNLSGIINEVDIKNLLSIYIKTNYNVDVLIGTTENIDNKLYQARTIIEKDLKGKGLKGTLDVSFDGNPVFKPD
mgnify:CR=1 FL=1